MQSWSYGIAHIVFGTDYGPVPISRREHIDMVLDLGLTSEDQEKILRRNADRLVQLDLQPTPDQKPRTARRPFGCGQGPLSRNAIV
jgi:hypothetical protein